VPTLCVGAGQGPHCVAKAKVKLRAGESALVYVRQSTPQQVLEHQESTAHRYALADWAVAFDWPRDRVAIIDDDLGQSGQLYDCPLTTNRAS
jgi:hypothetical protein